ncbi:MAG: hypothetical protein ACUVTF_02220 [bacterium]
MKRLAFLLVPLLVLLAQESFDKRDPREIIEKVRMYKLTETLDLTEEQTAKFFPHLKEMRKNEQDFQDQRMVLLQELRNLVKRSAREQEIIDVLNKLQELQKKRMTYQMQEIESLKKILTPVQQAKFLIFQEDFEREIRELIREVKKGHRKPPED